MSPNTEGRKRILDLIANDTSGLLDVKGLRMKSQFPTNSIIERNLQEILDFATEHGHLPKQNLDSVWEYQLATRLENAKKSGQFDQVLAKVDKDGLLARAITAESKEVEVSGLSDRFNLLPDNESSEIFRLVHVKPNSKLDPSHMSHRIRCLKFFEYEPLFSKIHSGLSNKTRRLVEFEPEKLVQGSFFAL